MEGGNVRKKKKMEILGGIRNRREELEGKERKGKGKRKRVRERRKGNVHKCQIKIKDISRSVIIFRAESFRMQGQG